MTTTKIKYGRERPFQQSEQQKLIY